MPIDLPLETMSVAEKIEAMEALWTSLCADPVDVISPAWHERVLEQRRQRLAEGHATVSDWADAKKRLQDLGR